MNLYLSNKKMSSTIELPYNEPLTFKRKNVFNHRITIQWNFTFQTKKCLQPSNYHTMNLYLSHKNMSSNIELPYNETLPFQQKNVSTIELHHNELLPFKQKNVFNHRITIQWTFTFLTKKCLQLSNYHTMNLYHSNKKMSSTIELQYNEPSPFKQKNVFNHQINIQWTFNFQTKKWLQPSNYHTRSLYLSNKKMSSTIKWPYNEPLLFKQKNVFTYRITIQWTFTFQKKCLQPSNYHTMNLYLSNKKMSSTIQLPSNEPLHFK